MAVPVSTLILACRQAFEAGDYAAVLVITQQLTTLHPERPEAWKVRAEAFIGLGRPAEALAPYANAVALTPGDAELLVRQARALERCGRLAEAADAYGQAFATDPARLSAVHGLITYRHLDPDDPALAPVRAIAAGAPATPGSRAFAHFLLGRLLLNAGRDGEAFAHYEAANRLQHRSLATAPAERGPAEFLGWWRWRQAPLNGAGTDGGRWADSKPCPALLVAGLPRSGKSLVEHLLSSHPQLAAGEEFGGLQEAVEAPGSSLDPQARLQTLVAADTDALAEIYARGLLEAQQTESQPTGSPQTEAQQPTAQLLVDTHPSHLWDLGYLAALQPQVPVVLCSREPLDLGVAIFFKSFRQGHRWSCDQLELGGRLAAAEHAIHHWQTVLPNPLAVVDYSALVADPIGTRDRLLRRFGHDPALCRPLSNAATPDQDAPAPHPSHSPPGYGPIHGGLEGCGQRFAEGMAPMLEAYRQTLRQLEDQEVACAGSNQGPREELRFAAPRTAI